MSGERAVNLDTSVIFNYVYATLPGEIEPDKGSQRLVDGDEIYCVGGGKAAGEFDALCERRYDLYDDLLDWLEANPDASIYEYDPTRREIHTSSNDLEHIRLDVQHEWGDAPRREQLSDIRRCMQDLGTFQDELPRLLDEVYEQMTNEALLEALDGLGLDHDTDVVVDAVEINRADGIDTLASFDSDLVADDQTEAINDAIRDVEDESLVLVIVHPEDV